MSDSDKAVSNRNVEQLSVTRSINSLIIVVGFQHDVYLSQ